MEDVGMTSSPHPNTEHRAPNTPTRLVTAVFLVGAVIGGVLAGPVGGVLGAGLALAALAVARAPWSAPLRAILALLIVVAGFGGLWVGAGFVRATLGLIAAGRLAQ
jgi:hypothetical protein